MVHSSPNRCVAAQLHVDGGQRTIEKIEKYEKKRHAAPYCEGLIAIQSGAIAR
jgi:hypothetical protein